MQLIQCCNWAILEYEYENSTQNVLWP